MGRAPQRDVLSEEAVPEVVEREAEEAEGAADGDEEAADGGVPVADEVNGGGARAPLRQRDGEVAGGEDAEEPEEDQVVGRVGERPGVTTGVDVERDVPVHAEERHEERGGRHERRERGPAGKAGDAFAPSGRPTQVADAAGAVASAEPHDESAERERHHACDRHLVERRAAGGGAVGTGDQGSCERGDHLALGVTYPCIGECNINSWNIRGCTIAVWPLTTTRRRTPMAAAHR